MDKVRNEEILGSLWGDLNIKSNLDEKMKLAGQWMREECILVEGIVNRRKQRVWTRYQIVGSIKIDGYYEK